MDYDFITTCNWTSTGTFTLRAFRGSTSNIASSVTLYYRKKGSPTWNSTTNGQINIASTGEWEVANDWNKSGNDVLTHSYYGITAINSCTDVYFNESTLGTTIGGYFLYQCWHSCTNLVSMPEGFNLPQGITSVGYHFLQDTWFSCQSLISMPEGFNLPQGIISTSGYFLTQTWYYCQSLTSMPEGFNLPPYMVNLGYGSFLSSTWAYCYVLRSMPEGFNLPQGITILGGDFLLQTWRGCEELETMPSGFDIPSGITNANSSFFQSCWYNCTNLKQDGYTEDLVFEFDSDNTFGGSCPIVPDSITGASKENPVRVAVNRPPPPPDVTVDVEPDETVFTNPSVSVVGKAVVATNVDTIVFTNPSVDATGETVVTVSASEVVFTNPSVDATGETVVTVSASEVVFDTKSVDVFGEAIANVNTNEIVFTNPSVDVAVQANIIIDVSANETNLNSLGVNITGGEGISFDTSTDQAIFTNLAIKAVEQGGGYSPLASILNFISPEITVETEYNWYFPNKANSKWKKLEAVQTEWTKNSKIKTNWKKI